MNNTQKRQWYALYTLTQHERKVQMYLQRQNLESFLPMRTEVRQWSDRKKKVTTPLFPGYLFVKMYKHNFWTVDDIPGAIRLVGTRKSPTAISEDIIDSIQKMVLGNAMAEDIPMRAGEKIRMINGPFSGVEGTYLRRGTQNLLVVEIKLLRRSVSVEISPYDILKLEQLDSYRTQVRPTAPQAALL
ncbi:MAG: UpxY family transcription antiterminator [Bacteroidota bacterium]